MDVQCERCKTEYEFDDALVSGRGTTVKCTNCGFQFKVRPMVPGPSTERWTVRRMSDGTELVFTTLRELQRAITQRQVGRNDTLSRGNGPPRPLGHIAELEPFFRTSDRPVPLPGATAVARDAFGTNAGFPGAQPAGGAPISPYAQTTALPSQSLPRQSQPDDRPPKRANTLRPPSAGAPPPPTAPPAHLAPIASAPPATSPYGASPVAYPPPPPVVPAPDRTMRTAPVQAPYAIPPPARVEVPAVGVLPPPRPRYGDPSYPEIDTSEPIPADPMYSIAPQRRRMGGFIVAIVLTAGVGLIGYRVGEPYLSSSSKTATAAAALDPRAAKFLTDGEHAIEDGNLDLAKENFDKASALQEKDPHVLIDLARLAAIRADIPWLKQRLFLPDAPEEDVKAVKQQLVDRLAVLRKAADDASAASPDDPAAARAKVDALRLAGDVTGARALVPKMGSASQTASQPEAVYVLAALDLAEIAPLWSSVIERLRTAAAAEGNLGRARAALVYALAKNGDIAGATSELEHLSPRNPITSPLKAFLQKTPAKAAGDAGPAMATAGHGSAVDVNSLPHPGASGPSASDPRVLVEQAAEAENRGQFDRASKLYEDALHGDANNSEALAGLGSVSLKQGDPATARQFFAKALAKNPNFVPALVGQADALWKEGDKNGAVAKYKDIVDRFPESSGYPSYCKTRAAGSSSGSGTGPTTETPAPRPAAGGKPGELSLPANTPGDLPGSTP